MVKEGSADRLFGGEEVRVVYLLGKDPCSGKVCVRFGVLGRVLWLFAAQ